MSSSSSKNRGLEKAFYNLWFCLMNHQRNSRIIHEEKTKKKKKKSFPSQPPNDDATDEREKWLSYFRIMYF
jgi:hypothetical protein